MLKDERERSAIERDALDSTDFTEFGIDNEALVRLRESKRLAKTFYTDLKYHNWEGHILEVEAYVLEFGRYLISQDVPLDIEACLHATYWHDADYPLDPKAQGLESKEQVSAHLARTHLTSLLVPVEILERAIGAISSTERGVNPMSNEDTLVSMSDLINVAGDRQPFFVNTIWLAYEKFQLGTPLKDSLSEYLKCEADYLSGFFLLPFTFTRLNGNIITMEDFLRFSQENISSLHQIPIALFSEVLGEKCCRELPDTWFSSSDE